MYRNFSCRMRTEKFYDAFLPLNICIKTMIRNLALWFTSYRWMRVPFFVCALVKEKQIEKKQKPLWRFVCLLEKREELWDGFGGRSSMISWL